MENVVFYTVNRLSQEIQSVVALRSSKLEKLCIPAVVIFCINPRLLISVGRSLEDTAEFQSLISINEGTRGNMTVSYHIVVSKT